MISPDLLEILACPRDQKPLSQTATDSLSCPDGHRYPVVRGIPVMLLDDVPRTHESIDRSLQSAQHGDVPIQGGGENGVDPFVQEAVAKTNGILYQSLVGKLTRYPIPEFRFEQGSGELLLDIGCNWGRWCIAAARRGYRPVGIDPDLEAVLAATRVARQLGVEARFVVGDARYLPFKRGSFGRVFSYSVIQHFSRSDAKRTLSEIRRVLVNGGQSLVQMPNAWGIRSAYHLARRRFRDGDHFEVRYWTVASLERTFEETIGATTSSVDGFFGLGIQPADASIQPPHHRVVIGASERLRHLSEHLRPLRYVADSVYLRSVAR